MAATNATTTKKSSTTTTTAKPASSTTPAATTRASTLTGSAATNGTTTPAASSSGLPTFDLATFLGLPSVIDYQDIAIRGALVVVGVVLVILVAWSFVRGKTSQNVTVQAPAQTATKSDTVAEEAAA